MKNKCSHQAIEIVLQSKPDQPHQSVWPAVYSPAGAPKVSECNFHEDPSPASYPGRPTGQRPAEHLRCCATHRYPARIADIIPGTLASHKNGRTQPNSRTTANTASAPAYRLPSSNTNRITDSNSFCERPSSAPTRGSCSGATARPRRFIGPISHLAVRVQNSHSASKKSQPRACRPLLSVISDANEIMAPHFIAASCLEAVSVSRAAGLSPSAQSWGGAATPRTGRLWW